MTFVDSHAVEALLATAGERGPAKVRFHRNGAELTLADGRRRDLPYAHASLGWGGAKDELPMLTLVAGDGEVVRLYFDDRRIFRTPPEAWPDDMKARATAFGRSRRAAWLLVPGVAAVGLALWLSGGMLVEGLSRLVPPAAETKIGTIFADATIAGKVEDDAVLNEAVTTIGKALVAQAPGQPYPFRFRVVEMPIENAFAFPGGEVVVTTGLLAASTSADELAGVLGHEVQHVLNRHTTKRLMQELGLTVAIAFVLGDMGTVAAIAATYGRDLVGLSFGREQELESDREGLALSHGAGFDPKGLGAFFERMEKKGGSSVPAILSSHPSHGDRLAQLAEVARALGPVKAAARPKLPDWALVRRQAKL